MFGLFRKKAEPEGFWAWLAANANRIKAALPNYQGISQEIGRAFDQSYSGLVWEISPSKSEPWLFCISADGKPELFPRVIEAVKAAPTVPGWKIQAFRPRGKLTARIEMDGRTLDYDDIWCDVQSLGSAGFHVTLLIRGLTSEAESALSNAALIMLDNAVGEYDAVMKIRQLGRGPLPADPKRTARFFPLRELPPFFDGTLNN